MQFKSLEEESTSRFA